MGADASDRTAERHGRAADERPTPCLSPDECLAFLQGGVRERQHGQSVHRHLDECDACRTMMAEAVRSAIEPGSTGRRPVFRMLGDGERVAERYQIQRFIARGGMGEVYEALDTVLSERVALKTLAITTSDQAEAAEGLLREVRIARKVVHPNVCRILELGIHCREGASLEKVPFLTMDFLEGETLRQRITRVGPLSEPEVRRITRGLVAGLATVHDAGIVHRDFKSENVFLVRTADGMERPLVMDFGLARAFEGSSTGASTGRRMVGTASHMAPEQVTGQAVTAAADVFALGIVIFEMLTGRLPFSGDSFAALALSRLRQTAPTPSSLVPGLDRTWDAVIARCLEVAPQRRFTRVTDIVNALEGVVPMAPRSARSTRANIFWSCGLALAVGATVASGIVASRATAPIPSASPSAPSPALANRHAAPLLPPVAEPVSSTSKALPDTPEELAPRVPRSPSRERVSAPPLTIAAHKKAPRHAAETPTEALAKAGSSTAPIVTDDPLTPPPPRPRDPDDLANPF